MKNILVGTDFSPAGNRAVRYAAEMAFQYQCSLIVVHATQWTMVSESPMDLHYWMTELQASDGRKMRALESALQRKYDHRLDIKTAVEMGFVLDVLNKKVKALRPDLVVLGIAQIDFLSRKLLGSTGLRKLDDTSVPVLIVPEKTRFKPIKKMVFAADGIPLKSKHGAKLLSEMQSYAETQFTYIHIKDELYPNLLNSYWRSKHKTFNTSMADVHTLTSIPNRHARQLLDWCVKQKGDWLITVARDRNPIWQLFHESVSARLAYFSSTPLLLIHE